VAGMNSPETILQPGVSGNLMQGVLKLPLVIHRKLCERALEAVAGFRLSTSAEGVQWFLCFASAEMYWTTEG
jgi:hypothetical protein